MEAIEIFRPRCAVKCKKRRSAQRGGKNLERRAEAKDMVRIMIVEDQTMVRDALKNSLNGVEDFNVIAAIADAALAELYCFTDRRT